jgi:hypothetical protein
MSFKTENSLLNFKNRQLRGRTLIRLEVPDKQDWYLDYYLNILQDLSRQMKETNCNKIVKVLSQIEIARHKLRYHLNLTILHHHSNLLCLFLV